MQSESELSDDAIRLIRERYVEVRNKTAVAGELGHSRNTVIKYTADIDEYEESMHESIRRQVASRFGGPTVDKMKSCGIKPRRLPRTIGSVDTHVLEPTWRRVAFISCPHFPYEDRRAVGAVMNYLAARRFDLVVLAGDQCDFYKISRFSTDARRLTSTQEEISAVRKYVRDVSGVAEDVIWIEGNHDDRMRRLINDNGLAGIEALESRNLFGLPEHWAYAENQAHIRLGPLLMLHGDLAGQGSGGVNVARKMLDKLRTSCLFGHFHRFDRAYHTDYDGVVRGAFACAHLCDVSKMEYIKSPNWQCGFCEVDFDPATHLFEVRDHLITGGKFFAEGRVWES